MTDGTSSFPEEYRKHLSADRDWKEIVAWVGDLPPLPHVATRALSLIEDPSTSTNKLAELLCQDTALAARVLKIANSAMFARQREITTINQAITVVGYKTLKGIIIAAALHQLNRTFGPIEQAIWQNSTCCATAARSLSRSIKKPYFDETFLLGLLHDLGKLILMRQIPDDYEKIVEITKAGEQTFVEIEQQQLGFSHTLIGALVAKKWNFPMDTCQIILHHHNPLQPKPDGLLEEKTLVIQASDFIAHSLGYGHFEGYKDQEEETLKALSYLGLEGEKATELIEKIGEEFGAQGEAFS